MRRPLLTLLSRFPVGALGALGALLALAPGVEAQLLDKTAYGLFPETVAEDRLPGGWMRLSSTPLAQALEEGAISCDTLDVPPVLANGRTAPRDNAWPNGIVPYEFDANVTGVNRLSTLGAMFMIQDVADVTFVLRTNETAYLHIQDDNRNQSTSIGFFDGETIIRMTSWNNQAVIVHELMHALGFYHTQSRLDRASFVTPIWANIQASATGNFALQNDSLVLGPYDFASLMHYDDCAFSNCCAAGNTCACPAGWRVLLTQPAFSAFQSSMGQRVGMSPLDVHALRSLYPEPHWRFVFGGASQAGDGTGLDPWEELSEALLNAPSGARVFAMPDSYSATGLWGNPMTVEAPVGGVVLGL